LLSGKNKILILDENFSHVAKNKQEQIGNMLSVLAEKLGVQLILITHEDELNPPGNKCFEI
jgi:ABC-type dipeptide/oligopeptide/nickel transport system ATPase subunit